MSWRAFENLNGQFLDQHKFEKFRRGVEIACLTLAASKRQLFPNRDSDRLGICGAREILGSSTRRKESTTTCAGSAAPKVSREGNKIVYDGNCDQE